MPFWPFKRKKKDDQAYFSSTSGAQVAPEAPLVFGEAASPGSSTSPTPPETGAGSFPQPAATAAPAVPGHPSGLVPPEVLQQLAAAGIHLDPKANVQVSTQTAELTGRQAMQFLGQLSSFLGSVSMSGGTLQMHPQVQIVADGRLQESPEQLKAQGLDAQATVKDLQEKVAMAGGTHVVKLKLEVKREGAEPYEVTTGAIVPAKVTEQFAEGKSFAAKVDPNDRNQVLVLWPES